MPTIQLNNYRTPGTRVFSGRERGKAVRDEIDFAALELTKELIVIEIPEDTIAFNPSFFLGLFGDTIRRLGRAEFDKKYNFSAKPIFNADIEEGKQRALLESKVLVDRPQNPTKPL